jgi:Asp-tRNA(Asn)/Glu-tRNA(Gln) amidotransferase A subunit family amidase
MPDAAGSGLNVLGATEIAQRIRAGETTAEAVTRDCLARIEAREATVKAWAHLDPGAALAQARVLDAAPPRGALHGVPVGIKDIFATADMPTGLGSPIYDGHRPAADASCVALLRAAGAVILGKTVTCEFAGMEPGNTTNPHDPGRTPGGSSSGSAAGVADGMMPLALGTQTGGSVLRPSSFCGIVGFKPSYNAINRQGLCFAAENLDTIGIHARSVDDVDLCATVLCGREAAPGAKPAAAPVIGLCRTPLWETAQPETVEAVEDSAARLAAAGAQVSEIVLPGLFDGITAARDVLNNVERSRGMAHEWNTAREKISARLRASIEKGYATPEADYIAALELLAECRAQLAAVCEGLDALLCPCVPGEAPTGLAETGAPGFQGFFTALHVPSLTLPTHRGPNGMPVGIQLVGHFRRDPALLAVARWAWDVLGGLTAL